MRVATLVLLGLVAAMSASAAEPQQTGGRQTLLLDGNWQIAEGSLNARPPAFDREIVVPGLVDMARPPFIEPGPRVADPDAMAERDPRREAFWYRRTFTLKESLPDVAKLKIGKAMFGTRVFLNGKLLGDHAPSFTPGYFDVRDTLRQGENELVIRIGAERAAIAGLAQTARDVEKSRYIPGIFDSVELILSGAPHIVNVQAVPDIEKQAVTIHSWVRVTEEKTPVKLHVTVREARSRTVVAEAACDIASPVAAGEATGQVTLPLRNCRLWSPEDPFLYELEVRSAGDCFITRFGMRSFRLDPDTGRAVLNGKPYFLRGGNITIYRFFEDEKRGALPWNEEWVRRLHRECRTMHWNSLRYCFGFPPDFWYRIADEEGILLQDEFPIWWMEAKPGIVPVDQLAGEYREWMQERWNHPSVVIWDACNETVAVETGEAIKQVRHLDFSNRPWDNGWGVPVAPGDSDECHPYHFSWGPDQPFRLRDLARDPGTKAGLLIAQPYAEKKLPRRNPLIINEYGGLWLNRDGTPTTLARRSYGYLTDPSTTPAQRRLLYARTMAAITEFFRAHRQAAGVLHLTALGYSRPDGQTCDDWQDVEKLIWQPDFFRYMRDAFSPVGLMLDFWADEQVPGETRKLPVILINDLYESRSGEVRLRLLRGGEVLASQTQQATIPALGEQRLCFSVVVPVEPGAYTFDAELLLPGQPGIHSLRDFEVLTPEQREARRNLAAGCPVRTSWTPPTDIHDPGSRPQLAVDGHRSTSATIPFGEWLAIDLGTAQTVSRLEIAGNFGLGQPLASYVIQVSPDGENWQEVFATTAGTKKVATARFQPVATRWVRLMFRQVEKSNTFTLNEVFIYR
jgi:beta-galactosidase